MYQDHVKNGLPGTVPLGKVSSARRSTWAAAVPLRQGPTPWPLVVIGIIGLVLMLWHFVPMTFEIFDLISEAKRVTSECKTMC